MRQRTFVSGAADSVRLARSERARLDTVHGKNFAITLGQLGVLFKALDQIT
jgi:hypothetical protein